MMESLLNYVPASPSQGRGSRHEMQGFKRNFEWHIKPHIRVFLCAANYVGLAHVFSSS